MKTSYAKYKFWPIIAVLPCLIMVISFCYVPAIINTVFTFTDFTGNVDIPVHWIGIKNYVNVWTMDASRVLNSIKVTFTFAIFTVIIQNVISIGLALLLNLKMRLSNLYRTLFFMPSIFGIVVVGLSWNLILDPVSGPVNYVLSLFGVHSSLLGDIKIAIYIVGFVAIWSNFGFSTVIYLSGLQTIPGQYYEAAEIDGAGSFTKFRHITLPFLRPSLNVNLWLCIVGTLNMFEIMLILTGGGPAESTKTFALYYFNKVTTETKDMGQVAAMGMYWFILLMIILILFNKFIRRKEIDV